MRIELKLIETIESYLMGTLSGKEKEDFESQMKQNPQLKQQVDLQNQIMQGIQRFALKSNAQKAYKSYKIQSFSMRFIVISALVTGVAFGVMKLMEENPKTEIPTEYNETQTQIIFPINDTLSADANKYLEQEIFKLNTQNDTIVETRDGIVIYIPANAFNTTETEVDLLIQEATTPEDLLMAGLSTVTENGTELETGGMFYVDAYVNGKRVELAKELTVDVPASELKAGMKLYDGRKNADGEIVWTNPKPLESFLKPIEIIKLDFYPPNYADSLRSMGYSKKKFLDSLYYSFACEEIKQETQSVPVYEYVPANWNVTNNPTYEGKQLFEQNCASCHFETKDMTGPALVGARERWIKNSNEENFYKFIKNSSAVIASGDKYANQLFNKWRTVQTPQALTNEQIDEIFVWVEWVGSENKGDTLSATSSATHLNACQGINPASIKTIWNNKFNNTNLATKEFEERMPWIHKSCENAVLDLYINNLDKTLSQVDSMALKYLSGDVLEKFKYFASRGDGRVEMDNVASKKLASYYEKNRDAETKALIETQQNYRNAQGEQDLKNSNQQLESHNRNATNKSEIFENEYKKNLCKVYDELDIDKDCNNPFVATSGYTVQVTNLGWNNIDRDVFYATFNRTTTTISQNGKTSTLTYNEWSATISDFAKYDRINVYNIPVEFNSYVKINGNKGNYKYKLNADLTYETVVLAWTEDAIYFFKTSTTAGHSEIKLCKVSDNEWRNEIQNSLSSITNMSTELDYTKFMQKDQKRVNTNKEKIRLREKIEPVVFPCYERSNGINFGGT